MGDLRPFDKLRLLSSKFLSCCHDCTVSNYAFTTPQGKGMYLSLTHAVGIHYKTYGEIGKSHTLLYASLLSLILPLRVDIRTRKYILHRWVC